MALSSLALPVIQTAPARSMNRPCSLITHGLVSGKPHPWTKLPSASNSMTDGAGAQHVLRGGLSVAPFSSSVRVRGRCRTQTWSLESTATLATWPNSQLLGNGLGHDASTWNCGTVWAESGEAASSKAAAPITARADARIVSPPESRRFADGRFGVAELGRSAPPNPLLGSGLMGAPLAGALADRIGLQGTYLI